MTALSMNAGIDFEAIEMNPMTDAGPIATDRTWNSPKKAEAIPEAIAAKTNGNFILRLTPKIAGSVIPSNAETPAEEVRAFCFWLLVAKKIAKVAAPCPMLAIEATGKIKEPPVLATLANNWVSIAGKVWWSPVMTMAE